MKKRIISTLSILFMVTLIIVPSAIAQSYGTWNRTDSLKVPRDEAASVSLANGNVLVSGGAPALRTAEIFNYKTEKWHFTDSMEMGRSDHKLVRMANGNVLAIGGVGTKSCEIYNADTKSWSLTGSMHFMRSWGETATLLDNGNVLVTGGHLETAGISKNLSSCELYNPQTGQWTVTDSLKINRWGHTATKLNNGSIIVVGGSGGSGGVGNTLNDCELYNPSTNKWTEAAPLHYARAQHAATLLPDGDVLVTGGEYNNKTCELYNPDQNMWTVVDSLMTPHTYPDILLNNGLLLVTGGSDSAEASTWELYNLQSFSNIYQGIYPGKYKQIDPVVNLLPDGKVLFAGGKTTYGRSGLPIIEFMRVCYLYDPNGMGDSIEQEPSSSIKTFRLFPNYPNPFNPSTIITFQLSQSSHVRITIYNALGRKITTLVNTQETRGIHHLTFNSYGLSSGVYFYQIIVGKRIQTGKMVLVK